MIQLLPGDCRTVLATLPAESVHCVVTSPPYYALRDYQVAGQLGLEATPDAYIAEMVAVFREIRRVLRPDGTCWVNMGDSYASSPPGNKTVGVSAASGLNGINGASGKYRETLAAGHATKRDTSRIVGIKPKDLLLMPARLALALQADGWWLRSDIIWHKPNPMPESVTDRPTSSHEHIFLLAKSPRYFFDAEAVREEGEMTPQRRGTIAGKLNTDRKDLGQPGARLVRFDPGVDGNGTRNVRNVWTIATQPYSGAHFAVFPAELAERCIRAGTSERGCCAACGAPWRRTVVKSRTRDGEPLEGSFNTGDGHKIGATGVGHWRDATSTETTGWLPSCACNADVVPCRVLDCFAGAGTTGLVADRLQRDAILIELNPAYTEMAMARCRDDAPLFAAAPPPPPPPPPQTGAYDGPTQSDLFAALAK